MMVYEYPEMFARFYDVIYHTVRDGVDNDFFRNEILRTRGKILEIGVGTGRMFMRAVEQGANIYGLDISPAMLNILKKKLPEKHLFRVSLQNMIDFHFDFKFDLIIAPFRVMMHLTEKEEQLQAINNVYRHLKKNGRFIFDVFVPDLYQLLNGLNNHTDFDGEYEPGKRVRRIVSTKPDLINQIINVNFRLEWDEDNKSKSGEWDQPLRYFFRYELEHLIERSKFSNYKILGDYQGHEIDNASKEFIVICHKT